MNNCEGPCKETDQMIINRLEEENYKLKEEVKQLLNELLEQEKKIFFIKEAIDLCVNSLNSRSNPK